ncbi:MAG TPA: FRG domain-containing protein [Polyangiaceae bacterium]|jgi:hypothetical protein|nr:FRG domain-containing protein [Polyangiaceae bacterium]
MKDIRISTWNELTDELYAESWSEPLGRFRSNFAFRGMGNAGHSLRTSLHRLSDAPENVEGHILRNFRKYAMRDTVPHDSLWSWLALAQHHGLPTRLLDWTFSPLVALHFATENLGAYHIDAVVWCVDFVKANQHLPTKLRALLEDEGSNAFTADMLDRTAGSLSDFDKAYPDAFVVFFEPPSLDNRIINQFALFAMMSSPRARLDHWLADHEDLCRRIIIPARLKWEIRDKLDQANITERVLFPGLDGLSRWLKRYYTTVRGPSPEVPDLGRPERAEPEGDGGGERGPAATPRPKRRSRRAG